MPSRAEMRVRVERVLRGVVIAVLAAMLWQSLHEQSDSAGQIVNARGIGGGALAKWTTLAKAPGRIHMQLDSVPSKVEWSWLGALAGAGSSVAWSGDLAPLMIDAQPIASPTGGTRLFVAAPTGSSVVMSDDFGIIDTARAQNAGAALTLNSVAGQLTARAKGSTASTTSGDSLLLRKVLVIGEAGWESKFVVAALEEEGWKVDAFIRVAPGIDVTQGSAPVIDTAHYSAVVALDGAALPYANRIIEYARTGGGVVLAAHAASLDAMTPLRAGAVAGATAEARAIQGGESVGLASLALAPITSLQSKAVPVEKRAEAVAIAARRIGAGRALQVGYQDTWRWRMDGGEGAVRDHRMWWTRLVSRAVYAPRVARSVPTITDEAPMAGFVSAIGPSASAASMLSLSGKPSEWIAWLSVVLALAFIGEVTSRRLHGAS